MLEHQTQNRLTMRGETTKSHKPTLDDHNRLMWDTNSFYNQSQHYDLLQVCCLLERLRGAASASEPRTQKAIYEMGCSVMNAVLIFLELYKHEVLIA